MSKYASYTTDELRQMVSKPSAHAREMWAEIDRRTLAELRLNEAAPDLLATLERICAAESRMSGNNPIAGLCDEARAAIAKAKGE